ncbi:hypothetical protein ACH4HG_40215 [Streptomyces coeruleorubidus]|uniref:hypothetical protein n=1 Tax=Streptomyces coeruleorubidus TaxID=116188 RepID=UPI0037BA6257
MPTVIERVYEAEMKTLGSVDAALTGIRTRAVALLTIAALILTFSSGVGIVSSDSTNVNAIPDWASKTLVIIVAAMALIVLWIIMPCRWAVGVRATDFGYHELSNEQKQKLIEEDDAEQRKDLERRLALALANLTPYVNANESKIKKRAWWLWVCALLFVCELAVLAKVIFD